MKLAVPGSIVIALTVACAVIVISNLRAPKAYAREGKFADLYALLGMPEFKTSPATLAYPDPIVWERKASLNLYLNRLDEAGEDIQRLQELSPNSSSTYALQGDLLVARGHYPKAMAEWTAVLLRIDFPQLRLKLI